jgi:hypothetical protein
LGRTLGESFRPYGFDWPTPEVDLRLAFGPDGAATTTLRTGVRMATFTGASNLVKAPKPMRTALRRIYLISALTIKSSSERSRMQA